MADFQMGVSSTLDLVADPLPSGAGVVSSEWVSSDPSLVSVTQSLTDPTRATLQSTGSVGVVTVQVTLHGVDSSTGVDTKSVQVTVPLEGASIRRFS